MSTSAQRSSPTYPSPKYGPTSEYGVCELGTCHSNARATCSDCEGHFCRDHVAHDDHVGSARSF